MSKSGFESELDRIKKENPHLILMSDSKQPEQAVGAKNLKKELQIAFPKVKFRVRSSEYANGCSITVNWFGEPSSEEVDAISSKYQYGHMGNKERTIWTDTFGGALSVSTSNIPLAFLEEDEMSSVNPNRISTW